MDVLRKKADSVHDLQPLALVRDMTEIEVINRPTAIQVVTSISDFEGQQPFHGMCCSSDRDDTHSTDNESVVDDALQLENLATQSKYFANAEATPNEKITAETSGLMDVQDHLSTSPIALNVDRDRALKFRKDTLVQTSARSLEALQPYVEDSLTETVPIGPNETSQRSFEQRQNTPEPKKASVLVLIDR